MPDSLARGAVVAACFLALSSAAAQSLSDSEIAQTKKKAAPDSGVKITLGNFIAAVNVVNTGTGGFLNEVDVTPNQAPDIIAKAAFDPGWGHYEVFNATARIAAPAPARCASTAFPRD